MRTTFDNIFNFAVGLLSGLVAAKLMVWYAIRHQDPRGPLLGPVARGVLVGIVITCVLIIVVYIGYRLAQK